MSFNDAKQMVEGFFNGQYEVKKFLGEGSFACVYLVKHKFLDDLRAMKIVKQPLDEFTDTKDIFHEVMLATQLRHENIISIFDAGIISNSGNYAYFVMEYVPGGDLEKYLNSFIKSNISMPIYRVLDIIKQILLGLNTLHQSDPPLVHRDLKLNNVLLSYSACGDIVIKISDFGFAKEVTTDIRDIEIAGTQPYMAPECFRKVISTRSDIYAIGVIFYQLLTMHFPYDVDKFDTDDLMDLKPWKSPLVAPSHYNDKVSSKLDEIVCKCLEFNPDDRYQDASELLADVEFLIGQIPPLKNTENKDVESKGDYSEYILNDNLKRAFLLAKRENRLDEAVRILENEILNDYYIRDSYGETLMMWKSKHPDVKLVSKAFTVNLEGHNYELSCSLLKEAIAYNPSLKNKYSSYIDLWNIFIGLNKDNNLIKAVLALEELMDDDNYIKGIYSNIINILKTYSLDEIVNEAIRLVDLNNLVDGANLMEFAIAGNSQIRENYAYKFSLWKQNMKMHFKQSFENKNDTIDYAVDLGTTDSLISYYNNGHPIIIKNHSTGDDLTPSAVLIDENDDVNVGINAKMAILENNRNAVSEFKHNMGFPIAFKFEKTSRVMFPEELSAEVLKDLRVSAYKESGVNIEHAVICVSADSNPIKTRAVNEAAKLAGFKSHSLLPEPIAAGLAYGLRKDNAVWMIYDLGGGTFDVSLIRDNGGELEKIATAGLDNLGGNAIDWRVVNELFVPKIVDELGLDDFRSDNPKYHKAFAKLKDNAEISKKNLTEFDKTDICISSLFYGYDFRYSLNRSMINEIISDLLKHTFDLCDKLLDDNSISRRDVEKVILVGGSTLSPIVQELIAQRFDIEIESGINPLTVVAMGAAIYAGSLEKPKLGHSNESLSILLSHENDRIKGKVFSKDLRPSFLEYDIGFKNEKGEVRVPLSIDGEFKTDLNMEKYEVNVYKKDELLLLDEKSPNAIADYNIYIPYFNEEFEMRNSSSINDLMDLYEDLLKDIDYLNDFSKFSQKELLKYVETLLQIAKKDKIALNQTEIYLNHLSNLVQNSKREMEFSILLNNVENKLRIVRDKNLFETEDIGNILKTRNLDELRIYYRTLIEKYVSLNKESVIRECFFNLKYDGLYISNDELANELIGEGQSALNSKDYKKLLGIVNQLHELDERIGGGI